MIFFFGCASVLGSRAPGALPPQADDRLHHGKNGIYSPSSLMTLAAPENLSVTKST
jgi:hypothetical protein